MKRFVSVSFLTLGIGTLASAVSAATLDQIKQKGFVQCGVSQGITGFSSPDDKGNWTGFDVDFCRALAAAIFNDPQKVKFSPLSTKDRFTALQSGEVDLLSRNTTWTLDRDTKMGLNFAGISYYDGQALMVRKSMKVNSALELSGASICTQTGTTTELNIADYFRNNKMKYEVVAFSTADETLKSYESGRCDVFTTDASQLYAQKLKLAKADEHVILPEIISKEPFGPVVRHGDDQWFDLVKWTLYALVNAEDLLQSALESENVARGRYKAGAGTLIDLLNAQSAAASARFQSVQARYNWHLAKAALASALGTLDLAALPGNADTVSIDTSRSALRK